MTIIILKVVVIVLLSGSPLYCKLLAVGLDFITMYCTGVNAVMSTLCILFTCTAGS